MKKHKILAFLLALIVSIGLWFYAVTVVNPNDTANIRGVRVRIVGTNLLESNKLMLTGGEEQFIDVEISGRRSDLKELNSSSLEAIADVSNISAAGSYEVSWTLDPPASVASGDIRLVSASANKITVKVSEYKERTGIPIDVEYEGTLQEGYVRDMAVTDVDSLSVSGPAEEVNRIAKAVVLVNIQDAKENVESEYNYTLLDADGAEITPSDYVKLSVPSIKVTVPVNRYKEIELTAKLIAGGGATASDVTCTIVPRTIGVIGSEEALAKLDKLQVAEIDLSKESESRTWTVVPDLPEGVSNRASQPEVKISLTFNGLTTKQFTIDCADIVRKNDVSNLEFGEQSVVITVRGRADAVNALSVEDIQVTADMKNDYDAATKTVKLTFRLPEGSKAGVIGEPYTVQVVDS